MVDDAEADPQEQNNIYGREKDTANDLFIQLKAALKEAAKSSFCSRQTIIDEKLEELLKTLGYLK